MQVLDFSTSHSQVVDEQLTVASSSATKLLHDVFYNKTGKKVVIATAASGGGTVLTETTDYTVGTAYPGVYGLDSAGTPVSIAPDTGYTTVAITNATYHNTTLYVSYYPIVDLMSASRFNTEIPVQFISATDDYTIISKLNNICLNFTRQAAGKTITLPDATTNSGQTITINVSGAGAGDVTLAGTGTQKINGLAIASWVFKGTGKLTIISDGANYKTDADHIWDTYKPTGFVVDRWTNNKMEQRINTTVSSAISTAVGNIFRGSAIVNGESRPINFITIENEIGTVKVTGQLMWALSGFNAPSTTNFGYYYAASPTSLTTQTCLGQAIAYGTWY